MEQQKKLAKELLSAYLRGDNEAQARVRAELPDKMRIVLADAQFVLAREYGLPNWVALRDHIERLNLERLSPAERFKRAVRARDVAELRQLLPVRAKLRDVVNAPTFGFDSPAIVAVSGAGNVELVDTLLQLGADPNRRSDWWAGGFHSLYGATAAVAERLLAAGAIPDACAAAHLDRVELLEQMLDANPARVHERGGDGQTPLHFARSRRVADLLIERGADVDAKDLDHRSTPAQWMLGDVADGETPRRDVARHLVERGASADIFLAAALGLTTKAREMVTRYPSLLALRTGQGEYAEKPPSSYHIYLWTIGSNMTPLQTASKFKQRETLDVLRELASPEQRLLLACHEGDRDQAQAIVRGHPGIVPNLTSNDRRALTDEAWAANAPAVELMLELGFDPGATSLTGPTAGTALHCAAWEGSVPCVAAILRYPAGRALIDVRDRIYGGAPLNWCCHGSANSGKRDANHAEVARLLIEAGGRVDPDAMEASEEVMKVLYELLG
jgi:ankyrin repeat protein